MNEKWLNVIWYFVAIVLLVVAIFGLCSLCGEAADDEVIYPTIIIPTPVAVQNQEETISYVYTTSNFHQFVYPIRPDILPVDPEDLEMLACVIYQEAGSDSISNNTRLMVGNVVLNRVADDRFPNSIEEVLLQSGQYGEYSWTGIRWLDSAQYEPNAVSRAYDCARYLLEGNRVLPEGVVWQAGFTQGIDVYEYSDGIYFCY